MGRETKKTSSQRRYPMTNKYMKRCIISLIIGKMQLKTTTRYITSHPLEQLSLQREVLKSVGEEVEKRELCVLFVQT